MKNQVLNIELNMLNHDLIQMNRFCNDLHNDENIVFCKIDFILKEFDRLRTKKNKIILIVCNGDYSFTDDLLKKCPDNIKHIFSTNTTCVSDKVTPIPIGVEMQVSAKRSGHGSINESIFNKLPYLIKEKLIPEQQKKEKILSNFSLSTNLDFRKKIKEISLSNDFFDFRENIPFDEFALAVKSNIGTLSPRGNGIECIRTYEILYLGEVPIVIGNEKEYESIKKNIYDKLPVVFISNLENLNDFNFIKSEINKVKNNSLELLSYEYWKNLIFKTAKKLT